MLQSFLRRLATFNRQPLYKIGQLIEIRPDEFGAIIDRRWDGRRYTYLINDESFSEKTITRYLKENGDPGCL